MEKKEYLCDNCELGIKEDSEYCPRCGTLFINGTYCENHPKVEAGGVCVICSLPFCERCGHRVNNVFLCNVHDSYEIYEGMARVFVSSDEAQLLYLKECLEENGLHPFVYSRKSSPMHLGGSDYSLFRASGDFNGHLINEIKLMVPCSEVLDAEKIITEIDLSEA